MLWPRRGTLIPVILAWLWGSTANLELPALTDPESVRLVVATDAAIPLARLEDMDGDRSPPRLESQLLRATLLSVVDRDVEAESVWGEVIDRAVWMRTFARRALVTSLVKRGEPDAAEAILTWLNRADAMRHLDLSLRVANL